MSLLVPSPRLKCNNGELFPTILVFYKYCQAKQVWEILWDYFFPIVIAQIWLIRIALISLMHWLFKIYSKHYWVSITHLF